MEKTNEKQQRNRSDGRQYKWIAFLSIFIIAVVYSLIVNVETYWYDAEWYWNMGDPVFLTGFNLLYFPETYRGYFFIVLVGIYKRLFPALWGWRILSAGMMAGCFSLSLPYVIKGRHIRSFAEVLRILAAFAVFMWIWGDFMQYPLSDFAAVFFLLSGAALLKSLKKGKKTGLMLCAAFCAGLFFYAAYNTRATNLYGILLILAVFAFLHRRELLKLLLTLIAVMAGMALLALPQCLINKQYSGVMTPKVLTENFTGKVQDLESLQVYWGLLWPRFEGYIGDPESFPEWAVFYDDPVGAEIIDRENFEEETFRLRTFLKRFLKYPLDMMGIYGKHIVSLMTPSYRQTYITEMFVDKTPWVTVSVLIWLIAGYGITEQIRRKGLSMDILWFLGICVPSLMQLFGAPEIRFFLMIYVLAYFYVFVTIDYRQLWQGFKTNWLQPLVFMAVIFCLWISVYGALLSENRAMTLLINDPPKIENTVEAGE